MHVLRFPRRTLAAAGWLLLLTVRLQAQPQPGAAAYVTLADLPYHSEAVLAQADDYQRSQCRLDLYLPTNRPGFATVVWFHGGGFTQGKRNLPAALMQRGVAVAAVSYRLAPPGKFPCFLEDGAAATAWVLRTIASHGGDPGKVFVSGHSAGGYLAMMLGLDARWLDAQGASARQLAGIVALSAQMTSHFHVRKLRGDTTPGLRPVIDDYAPLHHASAELPPICLVVGDRALDYPSRVEENAFMAVTLRNLGHKQVVYHEMGGLDHGGTNEGGWLVARGFVAAVAAGRPVGEAAVPPR